jgi:hypothetical protein
MERKTNMRKHLLTVLVFLTLPEVMCAQPATPTPATALPTPVVQSSEAENEGIGSSLPVFFSGQNGSYLGMAPVGGTAEGVGPLLVFGQHDPKALDEMAEDLNIFGFLVNQKLESSLGDQIPEIKMGVPMWLESGGHHIHASYIEGFGAIFNLRLGIPVVAPPAAEAKEVAPVAPSEWEKARAALYGGGDVAIQSQWAAGAVRNTEHYDGKVVEILKKQIAASLKSADGLRHVKSEEWIVVTITGGPNEPESPPAKSSAARNYTANNLGLTTLAASYGRPTMMTFRIKKATVASSRGDSEEEFANKVEVTSYLGADTSKRAAASQPAYRIIQQAR